jgi:hypothetical protein
MGVGTQKDGLDSGFTNSPRYRKSSLIGVNLVGRRFIRSDEAKIALKDKKQKTKNKQINGNFNNIGR